MALTPIKTPCIGVCSTGLGDDVCRGCKRFKHEVIDWNAYNHNQKAHVDARLAQLLSNIVGSKVAIVDEALLRHQLEVQPVDPPLHRDIYCQLFALLKAGASQIKNTQDFGFKLLEPAANNNLKALVQEVDQEFYILSVAHYQRYFQR